jgi:hypothetical protein
MPSPNDNVAITPGAGETVETHIQADGSQRQMIGAAEFCAMLRNLLPSLAIDSSTQRVRVVLESISSALTLGTITTVGTVTTVTTVATVTSVTTVASVTAVQNIVNIGGVQAAGLVNDTLFNAWATGIRGRIT